MDKQAGKTTFTSVVIDYIIPAIISAGVAIVLFGKVVLISFPNSDTFDTFFSLTAGLDNYFGFRTAWRPRLFSTALASFTVRVSKWLMAKTTVPIVRSPLELTVGLWTAGWFVLICFFLILFFKRRSLFYTLGLYAGISYGYLARLRWAARVYPWDMPALFFFTLFVLLFINKKYRWVFVMIPLSIGFKETGFILCLAFLFADLPWRQRLYMLAGSLALSLGVKIAIDLFVHAPLFLTMETRLNGDAAHGLYLMGNLQSFEGIFPYFINAGTLLAFLILPNLNRNILYLKLLAIPFIVGTLLFGNAEEYRIWFEVIPFALYALDVAIYGDPVKNKTVPAQTGEI